MTDAEREQQMNEQEEFEGMENANQAVAGYVKACLALSGKAKKDSVNPHFKSGFVSLESVLATILPSCHENDIVPLQEIIKSENGISVRTTIYHASGDRLVLEPIPVPVDKNNAQGVVSASTYGRRVSLMAIFGLAPSDDDGNAATDADPAIARMAAIAQAITDHQDTCVAIRDAIAEDDLGRGVEAWDELTDDEKISLWIAPSKGGFFTTNERKVMKSEPWLSARVIE